MSDDLNTLLIRMAGYPLYEQLLDTPGLAKDFNDLCNMAKGADAAVQAERKRIAAIATEYLAQYTSESKREPATDLEVQSAAKAAAVAAVMDAAGLR